MALANIPGSSNPSASVTKKTVTVLSGPNPSGGGGGGSGSGTVTSVATTLPVTGGTITNSGTIGINAATTATLGVVQPDGVTIGITIGGEISVIGGSSGTVTSVATGTGLTGGPITTTGTISLNVATTAALGGVIVPSSGHLSVDGSGNLTAPLASSSTFGVAKVDGTTVTASGGVLSAPGSFTNPMTTLGDMIDGGTAGAPTRLAGNTSLRRQWLSQTGTGSASAAPVWTNGPSFNVMDFGAIGDGTTNDTAAIQTAVNAAVAFTRAVVRFPSGRYLVTTSITTTLSGPTYYAGRISFVGDGEFGSVLIAGTNSIDVISADLNVGYSGIELRNLSFETASGILANSCINQTTRPTAGATVLVDGVSIFNNVGTGFKNGLLFSALIQSVITNITADSGGSTFDSGSGTGAGSGSLITLGGESINNLISNVVGQIWWKGIVIGDGSSAITPEGITIANINFTKTPYGIYLSGLSTSPIDGIQISNVQIDNGNDTNQTQSTGIYATYCEDVSIVNCFNLCVAASSNAQGIVLDHCQYVSVNGGTQLILATNGIVCTTTTYSRFSDIMFKGPTNALNFDSNSTHNRVRNCQDETNDYITVVNSGGATNQITIDALVLSSSIGSGSPPSLTNNTPANITNITIPVGTWLITGAIDFIVGSGAVTVNMIAGSSSTSATFGAQDTYSQNNYAATVGNTCQPIPTRRVVVTTSTTYYLVAQSGFAGGSVSAYGTITATPTI